MSKLFIVYCIDTEGPLNESIEATFERLKILFDIELKPSKENLKRLQSKEINLEGKENIVASLVNPQLLNYNNSWDKIDIMLDELMSEDYRNKYLDSNGKGIVYNWHCVDHIPYNTNERNKDIGYGNIYKYYKYKVEETNSKDKIHWHFHPVSFNKESHISATSYDNSIEYFHQIITRRLLENSWFPCVNRAGFHVIRQDSSFLLEQWIPFDFSNQATYEDTSENKSANRFGQWSRAPKRWSPYHPSHDDYQTEGFMNRYTTKCLNIGTRHKLLTDNEIEYAFREAQSSGKAILSFTNHDFRDMRVDIDDVYSRIGKISKKFKDVDIEHCDAIEAMQKYLYKEEESIENRLKLDFELFEEDNKTILKVFVLNGEIFGSQPYLAFKTVDGRYFHDNLNEDVYKKSWIYIFDSITFDFHCIDKISIASNDKYGNTEILKIK